jgi:hypothetical protein
MRRKSSICAGVAVTLGVFCFIFTATSATALPTTQPGFVENLGQWDAQARYHMLVGQTSDDPPCRLELWLTDTGYVYSLQQTPKEAGAAAGHAVALRFVGAKWPAIEPAGQLPGAHNWIGGSRDISGAKSYGQLVYRGVYSGIDLVFDAATADRVMETTWQVAPGADPAAIALTIDGADRVSLDPEGNLVLTTTLGDITELHPIAFQTTIAGDREPVQIAFTLDGSRLSFALGAYDRSRPLVIDPEVLFSRTFGGTSSDSVADMHEDATGRYFTGVTTSTDFPTTAGAYKTTINGYYDWYAAKFNLANDTLLWSTFIGGTNYEYGGASALASNGELVIAGSTYYPTISSFPYVYSYLNASYTQYYALGLFRLSADGTSRISCAIWAGAYYTYGGGVKINNTTGDVYVTGQLYYLTSYPWTNLGSSGGGYKTTGYGSYDAYVVRFNSDFSQCLNATVTAGSTGSFDAGSEVALDAAGNVYVMGTTYYDWGTPIGPGGNYDLFVAKYSPDLMTQGYDTRIGGGSTDPTAGYSYTSIPDAYYNTSGEGLIVDGSNRAWVTGMTASTDWPTTAGAYSATNTGNYDVFVIALNAAGTALDYSTLIGGSSTDAGRGIAFDSAGNVYIAGLAASTNYPTTTGAPQTALAGGYDFVLSVFNPNLSQLLFSTYWGGTGTDYGEVIAVGPDNFARVAGAAYSGFPLLPSGSAVFGPGGAYDGGVVSFDIREEEKPESIPTLTEWGMIIMSLLLAGSAIWMIRRRRTA